MRKKTIIGTLLGLAALFLFAAPLLPRTSATVDENWTGQYYQNPDLSGVPTFTREDAVISFDWKLEPPGNAEEVVGWSGDGFSVRWTKTDFFYGSTYVFAARSDDGIRFYVDGELIIDEWEDRQFHWVKVKKDMTQGEHKIVIEYYENVGRAAIEAGYYPKDNIQTLTPTPTTETDDSGGGSGGGGSGGGGSGGSSVTNTPAPRPTRPTSTPSLLGTVGPQATSIPGVSGFEQTILEESNPKNFVWFGFPGLVGLGGGSGGQYTYVRNHSSKTFFEGFWIFAPDKSGYYDVFIHIPETELPASRSAIYYVSHNGTLSEQIVVNQSAFSDEWVQIASIFFSTKGGQYVTTSNLTAEPDNTRFVLIDAVLFAYNP